MMSHLVGTLVGYASPVIARVRAPTSEPLAELQHGVKLLHRARRPTLRPRGNTVKVAHVALDVEVEELQEGELKLLLATRLSSFAEEPAEELPLEHYRCPLRVGSRKLPIPPA